MNLLGKILTGAIVIAALMLLCVSMMVYATHKNWKTSYDQMKVQLQQATNENQQLTSKQESLISKYEAELEAEKQDVRKLDSERVLLVGEKDILQKELDGLQQQHRSNTAAIASTQASNEELTKELGIQRVALRENQQARDTAFVATVKATDKLHIAHGDLSTLRERNTQLTQKVANSANIMRANGIDPNTMPGDIVPQIRGIVSALRRDSAGQMIEVTVGADDGLKKGHTIEIYRGDRYLGRAIVIRTEPDRAVARIIRKFQQGQIQENDHVATKLRVG